ncbi:MAG: GNAT family protein [Pseudomonadota bacterium]
MATPVGIAPVRLDNELVSLIPLEEAHRASLTAIADDPDLWRFATVNQHGTDFDAWFDERLDQMATRAEITFAVYDRQAERFAGSSSYLMVNARHRRLEIGWTWYDKPSWGTQINPACKHLLLTHGFDHLGLHRIEFKVDSTNARSIAAMEKLGAVREGTFRNHLIMPDGRQRHSVYFSILPDEWPAIREALTARLREWSAAPK